MAVASRYTSPPGRAKQGNSPGPILRPGELCGGRALAEDYSSSIQSAIAVSGKNETP